MNNDTERLLELLAAHWVLALGTIGSTGEAQVTPLFYALLSPARPGQGPLLVFASSRASAHAEQIGEGPCPVAASVQLETEILGRIRGAQLKGFACLLERCAPQTRRRAKAAYLSRHPAAAPLLAAQHALYLIIVQRAKLTDNRLGLGVHPILSLAIDWTRIGIDPPTV